MRRRIAGRLSASLAAARTIAAGLICAYVAYVIGAWTFLSTSAFERNLDLDPKKAVIKIERGWSWIPGIAEVVGGYVEIHEPEVDVIVEIPRATVTVGLWPLWFRKLEITRLITPDTGSAGQAVSASIHFKNPRLESHPAPAEDPWQITIEGVELGRISELRVDEWLFRGHARARGGFHIHPHHMAEVFPSQLEFVRGAVEGFADPFEGVIDARIHPYSPPHVTGMQVFRYLDARIRAHAHVKHVRFLNSFLRSTRHAEITGGAGIAEADLKLERGVFATGTRLKIASRELSLRVRSHRLNGSGEVSWVVEGRRGRLELLLGSLRLEHLSPMPEIMGEAGSLGAWMMTDALDLANRPFSSFSGGLDLKRTRVRLERLAHLLPGAIHLDGGNGELDLKARAFSVVARAGSTTDPEAASLGHLNLRVADARGKLGTLQFSGANHVRLDASVPPLDLNRDELSLSELQLRAEGMVFSDTTEIRRPEPGWWMQTDSKSMRVRFARGKPRFDADLSLQFRDLHPMLSWLEARGDLPKWARLLISGGPVRAHGIIDASGDDLVLSELAAELSGGLSGNGALILHRSATDAAFVGRLGPLSVGVRVRPEDTSIKLFAGDSWLAEQVEQLRAVDIPRTRQAAGRVPEATNGGRLIREGHQVH